MPIILSRKKSMALGLGLLGAFFLTSGIVIYIHNSSRIPPSSSTLSREMVEGASSTPAPQQTASAVGFVLNDFHRSAVKDGKLVWEIFGKRGRYDALQNRAEVEQPRLNVIRENGDTVNLTSNRAELTLSGSELLTADLFDHVVLVYKGETRITTDRAIYNKEANTVEMPNSVTIDNPIFLITGHQLVANLETQVIRLTRGVKSTFKPRKMR